MLYSDSSGLAASCGSVGDAVFVLVVLVLVVHGHVIVPVFCYIMTLLG